MVEKNLEKKQIQEIADIFTGLPITRYKKYPNLTKKSVLSVVKSDDERNHVLFKSELLPEEIVEKESFEKYFLKNNDIIFKTQSPNHIFYNKRKNIKEIIVPSAYIIIRIKEENYNKINPEYLSEILKSNVVKRQLNKYSEGKRSIMRLSNFKKIEIPILSIENQNEFSKLLNLINEKIKTQKEQIKYEKELKEGILINILGEED